MRLTIQKNGEIRCKFGRCDSLLGQLADDDQCLVIGDAVIWQDTRIHCKCGRYHFLFEPRNLDNDTDLDIDEEVEND